MAEGGGRLNMKLEVVKKSLENLVGDPSSPDSPEEQAAPAPEAEASGEEPADVKEEPAGKPRKPVMTTDYPSRGFHLDAMVSPDKVVAAAQILEREGFFLEAVTGVDWIEDEEMEVVYDYNSFSELCRVVVRSRIPRENPLIPTISGVFSGADWHERETHDFFGIEFEGHPNMEPLLLPEDADFHPLRKDYTP